MISERQNGANVERNVRKARWEVRGWKSEREGWWKGRGKANAAEFFFAGRLHKRQVVNRDKAFQVQVEFKKLK